MPDGIVGPRGRIITFASTITDYTLKNPDNGNTLVFLSTNPITLTIPADSLPIGYEVGIVQYAAGAVAPTAASGVTLTNRQSHTVTAGQGAFAALISVLSNEFLFVGDIA